MARAVSFEICWRRAHAEQHVDNLQAIGGWPDTIYALTSHRMRLVWGAERPRYFRGMRTSRYPMLDATLRDRARRLLTAVGAQRCSAVHGDGRDGGGGADRGGRRPCHSHGGRASRRRRRRRAGDRGRARARSNRADRLHLGARHALAARAHRPALPRDLRLRRRCRADRDHDRLVGRRSSWRFSRCSSRATGSR